MQHKMANESEIKTAPITGQSPHVVHGFYSLRGLLSFFDRYQFVDFGKGRCLCF